MALNKILILGIGNLLMNDEGIGIHVIRELEIEGVPGADLLDGGTGGFHLLGYIQAYRKIIIVDASLDDFPAGTVRVLHPEYVRDFPKQLSAHEIGLKDLIDACYLLGYAPVFCVVAVSVKNFQKMGLELSSEVKAALPGAIAKVKELAAASP